MALFSSHGKQLGSNAIVPRNTAPIGIHPAKRILGASMTRSGCTAIKGLGFEIILRHTFRVFIFDRKSGQYYRIIRIFRHFQRSQWRITPGASTAAKQNK